MAFSLLLYILLYPETKVFVPMTSMKTMNSPLTVKCVSVSSLTSYYTSWKDVASRISTTVDDNDTFLHLNLSLALFPLHLIQSFCVLQSSSTLIQSCQQYDLFMHYAACTNSFPRWQCCMQIQNVKV